MKIPARHEFTSCFFSGWARFVQCGFSPIIEEGCSDAKERGAQEYPR